jgi:hypothetical protein
MRPDVLLLDRSALDQRAADRAARVAAGWTIAFILVHVYWALGGRVGFGDQTDPIPETTSSVAGWIFTVAVAATFVAGVVVPLALVQTWDRRLPRCLLSAAMWAGSAVLLARGGAGLLNGLLRGVGFEHGLTGQSYEEIFGSAQPSAYTVWSATAIDAVFLFGGVLFARAAHLAHRRAVPRMPGHATSQPTENGRSR